MLLNRDIKTILKQKQTLLSFIILEFISHVYVHFYSYILCTYYVPVTLTGFEDKKNIKMLSPPLRFLFKKKKRPIGLRFYELVIWILDSHVDIPGKFIQL